MGLSWLRVRYCCGSAQLVSYSWPEAPLHSVCGYVTPIVHARILSCPGEGGRGTARDFTCGAHKCVYSGSKGELGRAWGG